MTVLWLYEMPMGVPYNYLLCWECDLLALLTVTCQNVFCGKGLIKHKTKNCSETIQKHNKRT